MEIKEKITEVSKELKKYPKWLTDKYYNRVREKAIERVKKELSFIKLRYKSNIKHL